MFRARIVKEITETRADLRFGTVTVLFGVLLVLGVSVGRKDCGRPAKGHRERRRYGRPGGGPGVPKGRRRAFGTQGRSLSSLPGSTRGPGSCIISTGRNSGSISRVVLLPPRNEIEKTANDKGDPEVVAGDSEGRRQVTVSRLRGRSW